LSKANLLAASTGNGPASASPADNAVPAAAAARPTIAYLTNARRLMLVMLNSFIMSANFPRILFPDMAREIARSIDFVSCRTPYDAPAPQYLLRQPVGGLIAVRR
jgi:hypothetical protein